MQQQRGRGQQGRRPVNGDAPTDELLAEVLRITSTDAEAGSALQTADNLFLHRMTLGMADPWWRAAVHFVARVYLRNYVHYMAHPELRGAIQALYGMAVERALARMQDPGAPEDREFLNFESWFMSLVRFYVVEDVCRRLRERQS